MASGLKPNGVNLFTLSQWGYFLVIFLKRRYTEPCVFYFPDIKLINYKHKDPVVTNDPAPSGYTFQYLFLFALFLGT